MRSGGPAVQRQPLRVELDCVHAAEMVHREAAGLPPGAADVVRTAGRVPGELGTAAPEGPSGMPGARGKPVGSTCMILLSLSFHRSLFQLLSGCSPLGSKAQQLRVTVA